MKFSIPTLNLLNTKITCLTFEEQIMLMLRWAKTRESRTVCLANVHMLMEAYWDHQFAQLLNKANIVASDGMPLVWMLRKQGITNQNQVAGFNVFINLCELAEQSEIGVYFVGSEINTLSLMRQKLEKDFPLLKISGMETLPFLTKEEIIIDYDEKLIDRINSSGAGIVFVCLGCPKQEIWMGQYQGKIKAVMIGVGAVFAMYSGVKPRAPFWIQTVGLEWLYRLLQEPRRLWRRYGQTIPSFLYLAIQQLISFYRENLKQIFNNPLQNKTIIDLDNLDIKPCPIGEILVRQGLLSRESLETALLEQVKGNEQKLGQILVEKKLISLAQLKYYLKNQKIKLGEILVERKFIKEPKIKKILQLQKNTEQRLGEMLVDLKLLNHKQVTMALIEQYWRRRGWWLLNESTATYKQGN